MEAIEKDILQMVLETNHSEELTEQLAAVEVKEREHTGVGLYVYFKFPENKKLKSIPDVTRYDGPLIKSSELPNDAGCIVWLEKGILDFLEIYSYSDSYPKGGYIYELKQV